jgi:hypothetical protein
MGVLIDLGIGLIGLTGSAGSTMGVIPLSIFIPAAEGNVFFFISLFAFAPTRMDLQLVLLPCPKSFSGSVGTPVEESYQVPPWEEITWKVTNTEEDHF